MIPYVRHHVTGEDETAVLAALRADRLTQGPLVEQLESRWAERVHSRFAIAVSSGSAALELAYAAIGVLHRRVLVPPITFLATANAARYEGGEVVWLDVDRATGCADLSHAPRAELLCLVTLGGQFPWTDLPHWPLILIDACHGPYDTRLCPQAVAWCYSLHPAKHVAAGEGGMIATNDAGVAWTCKALRDGGRVPEADARGHRRQQLLGHNLRLSELHAALALSQLNRLDQAILERWHRAARYDAELPLTVARVPHTAGSARHLYQVLVEDRDRVRAALATRGVGTQVCYRPVCDEPYWGGMEGAPDVPNARWHAAHTLSLPLYPTLTDAEQTTVIAAVKEVCG